MEKAQPYLATDALEREVVLAYLERERELWLPDYRRAERDGRMNAELNAAADAHMPRLNYLLDELSALSISSTMAA